MQAIINILIFYFIYQNQQILTYSYIQNMHKIHKRNTSQSIKSLYLTSNPNNKSEQKHRIKNKHSNTKNSTYSLVAKSSLTIPYKKIVVQQLENQYNIEDQEDQNQECFFAFGRKSSVGTNKKYQLDMDKITEVQDSNSKRQITSYRSHMDYKSNKKGDMNQSSNINNKENIFRHNLSMENNQLSSKNITMKKNKRKIIKDPLPSTTNKNNNNNSHRPISQQHINNNQIIYPKSCEPIKKTSKSNTKIKSKQKNTTSKKTKSTKSSHLNLHHKNQNHNHNHSNHKLQKSMKMLWQCMGQLWQNTRVSQYKSEKNTESIVDMKRKIEDQDRKILELKYQLTKVQNNNYGEYQSNGNKCGLRY